RAQPGHANLSRGQLGDLSRADLPSCRRQQHRRLAPRTDDELLPPLHEATHGLGAAGARGDRRRPERSGAAYPWLRHEAARLTGAVLRSRRAEALQIQSGIIRKANHMADAALTEIMRANIEVHTAMIDVYDNEPHFRPENQAKV